MAENESLGTSLSDEESESLLQASKKASPTTPKSQKKQQGFKFSVPTDNEKPDFDFATKSKTTSGTNDENEGGTNSSSDGDEDFEVINPQAENCQDGGNSATGSVPTTPTKNTPHKRTAYLAGGSSEVEAGVNGSPPSSPAAKKRKEWQDYLAEDDAKKKASVARDTITGKKIPIGMGAIILGILVAIAAVAFYYSCPLFAAKAAEKTVTKPKYSWKKASSNLYNWTSSLQEEFPHQNRETWIQLVAAISSTLGKTEPEHPASITVLLPPALDKNFASCFVKKVGGIVNKAVAPILRGVREPAKVREATPTTFDKVSISEFRESIEHYFHNEGKVLITWDVDKFTAEEHLFVFHGLCDNYKAVDKRATLLFPLKVPQEVFEKFEWIHERGGDITYAVLTEAWKNVLSADTGPAMQARIADAVILLNEGDGCAL